MGMDDRELVVTHREIAAELDAIADLIESVWEHGGDRQQALEQVEGRVIGLARRIRGGSATGDVQKASGPGGSSARAANTGSTT
jgi:hypothetical protein